LATLFGFWKAGKRVDGQPNSERISPGVVKILIPTELFSQQLAQMVNFDSNNRLGVGQ